LLRLSLETHNLYTRSCKITADLLERRSLGERKRSRARGRDGGGGGGGGNSRASSLLVE
jgi:hypothetical protein